MRRLTMILIASAAAAALAAAKPAKPPAAPKPGKAKAVATAVADSAIGLSRTSVFATPAPAAFAANTSIPGEQPKLARPFAGAPPRVPHGIGDFVPITREQNACVECHDRAAAVESGAVAIPASHYRDLRRAPEAERDAVAGARWVCVSCHVPQTDAPELVGNGFGR